MKSNLVDLELAIHAKTTNAVLVSLDGDKTKAVWLPRSQIELDDKQIVTSKSISMIVTMPEWLAIDKGLV